MCSSDLQINDLYGLLYPALRRLCEIRDRLLPNRQGRLHVEGGLPDAEPPLTPGVLEHQAESLMTSLRTSSLWASFGCGVLRYSACIASTDWRPPNARAITSSNHVSWKESGRALPPVRHRRNPSTAVHSKGEWPSRAARGARPSPNRAQPNISTKQRRRRRASPRPSRSASP